MLQTLLTVMLFVMPFLVLQKEIPQPGLFTGLWVSLFFWGRIHPLFSILIFGISLTYYIFQSKDDEIMSAGGIGTATPPASFWIPRSGARPLTGLLVVMMIFCAFGNTCRDFGQALDLAPVIQETALLLGFLGSLAGPFLFGILSDKTGPFTAFLSLLCLGIGAVILTALSRNSPYVFPFGSLLMQMVISGVFTLMPLLLLRFYGRPQLDFILPFLLLFLAGFWTAALQFYRGADALPQDYLLCMVFLLLAAGPLAASAWRRRLTVL